VTEAQLDEIRANERAELQRRERLYRDDRPRPNLFGKTVILVDDGLATGATVRAAIRALRMEAPQRIVVAVPVSAPVVCDAFRDVADEIICAETPEPFRAVGEWYDDFAQTTDEEVHELLERARSRASATA